MKTKRYKYAITILAIIYLVGIIGFSFPHTNTLFKKITPFFLLINLIFLIFYHRPSFSKKMLSVFSLIYLSSFTVEAIGVNSGLIFGDYIYGEGLGLKFFNTPIIIGLNWLMLIYCSHIISTKLVTNSTAKLFFGSFLMVLYDVILEHAAPLLDMWSWNNNITPIKNYLSWFILSFLLLALLQGFKIHYKNKLAIPVFIFQFIFFSFLLYLNN